MTHKKSRPLITDGNPRKSPMNTLANAPEESVTAGQISDRGCSLSPSGAQVSAVRELLSLSDRRDVQMAARLAAHAEGYRRGLAEAERARAEGYAQAVADIKATEHELVGRIGDLAAVLTARWRASSRRCRLAGYRPWCPDCQDRTRLTFADPFPGDYLGGSNIHAVG